jgi:lipopolysaccharide/colanic/teichoic acid biosynthesis glycosyltransferase
MNVRNKTAPFILFIGDVIFFIISLWITLLIRYGSGLSKDLFYTHFTPFSILFVVWLLVYFIAGLYEQYMIVFRRNLTRIIFNVQIINSLIAIAFFYLIPYYGITPKTNLFIYLVVSWALILFWRSYVYVLIGAGEKQNALIVSSGEEMRELREVVNSSPHSPITFISSLDLDRISSIDFHEEILKRIYAEEVTIIAIDFNNEKVEPILPHLYNLIFSRIIFIDMHKIYEDVFNRVPLSLIKYSWFLENISLTPKITYDFLKRTMDVFVAGVLGVLSLMFYPFIIIGIKLEDMGSIFFIHERIGKNNVPIHIIKFRTMTEHNESDGVNKTPHVTRVGKILRATRLDEIPQLWNVIRGDVSLIGPRPEIPSYVKHYEADIPYYSIRHLIKPGLSGWAQLYHKDPPKYDLGVEQTRDKLSYDLYYIKNRSFLLDVKIALKTIKELVSRRGR